MAHNNKAIGILGGTFDPIHFGHLRMALELYEVLGLKRVHITPCFQPVHRKQPTASPEHRLAMVQQAVKNEPALIADDREIKRQNPSYMIETIRDMHKEFGDTPLCLIVGIDAFLGFPSWHEWEEILRQAHIIVAHRPRYHLPNTGIISELIKDRLQTEYAYLHNEIGGGIFLHPITPLEISATEIRKLIAMGRNPRYLLPSDVYEYIKEHGIYSISRI